MWKEWEMKNWQREQMPRKWRGKGGEEHRNCDGMTALRDTWKEWEKNGEKMQQKELETADRERNDRKVAARKNNGNGNHGKFLLPCYLLGCCQQQS